MHGGHRWYRGSRMVSCWSMHRTLLEGVPSLPCLVMLECLPICWWYGLIGRVITLVIFGHYQYLQGQTCSVRSGWPTADGWLSVSEQLCSIGLSYAIISIANVIFLIALCMLPSISYYLISRCNEFVLTSPNYGYSMPLSIIKQWLTYGLLLYTTHGTGRLELMRRNDPL